MEGDEMEYESSYKRAGNQWDFNRMVGIIKVQNFVFLAFAYCTQKVYLEHQCVDEEKSGFLQWAFLGNLIVFIIILLGIIIMKIPSLYTLLNRCGAVFITIQTCLFQGGLIIFHFVFMIYSIQQHFWSPPTPCKEIELFQMVYAYVSIVWIFLQIYTCVLKIIHKMISNKNECPLDNQSIPLQNLRQ